MWRNCACPSRPVRPAELIERAKAALADSKFLEFRLDSLPKPAAALPKVKEFLAAGAM